MLNIVPIIIRSFIFPLDLTEYFNKDLNSIIKMIKI